MYRLLFLSLFLLTVACTSSDVVWYRGNTHVHTEICGHADSHPDAVAKWYLDNDYNFLILSEHNHFIDPSSVNLPKDRRKDFILVPGMEVTGKKDIHTTAMNIDKIVPWNFNHDHKHEIIQNHVDGVRKANGQAILNHPNWKHAVAFDHISKVKNLYMFELFNGHPHVHSHGDEKVESTEVMWDNLLTAGMLIYGVSSDDAHQFKTIKKNLSNPGRGWVMVNSSGELNPDALTHAMMHGNFYASNGVFLKKYERSYDKYTIEVDVQKTEKEIAKKQVMGKIVKNSETGFKIEFIADGGKVLHSHKGYSSSLKIPDDIKYLRAKVTLCKNENGILKEYYAWGQPVFLDDRSIH